MGQWGWRSVYSYEGSDTCIWREGGGGVRKTSQEITSLIYLVRRQPWPSSQETKCDFFCPNWRFLNEQMSKKSKCDCTNGFHMIMLLPYDPFASILTFLLRKNANMPQLIFSRRANVKKRQNVITIVSIIWMPTKRTLVLILEFRFSSEFFFFADSINALPISER